jgi:PAS domain S-box-containing protein
MDYSSKTKPQGGPSLSNQPAMVWLETIASLSQRLCLLREPSEICRVATKMMAEAFQVEKCVVLFYAQARQELVGQPSAYGLEPAAATRIRLSVKEGAATRSLWMRDEPWISDDLAADPRFKEYQDWSQSLDLHTVMACALRVGQRQLGAILGADKRSGERFNQVDAALLRILADQVGIALNNAETLNAQARAARRSQTLAQIAHLLHAALDPREVAKIAASMMLGAVGADRCHLFLMQESEPAPVLSVAKVEAGQQWKISDIVDDERARWFREQWPALDRDQATVIEDAFLSPLIPSAWTTQLGIKTLVLAPMHAKEALVGCMMIEYGGEVRHWINGEVAFIESIANQSALALNNARAYQAMRGELEPLRVSATTYPPLVEGAGAAIFIVQEGRYGYVAGAAVELLGYSPEEWAQMHLPDIFVPHWRLAVIESYERLLEGRRVPSFDAQAIRKDSQEVTLTLTGTLIEFEGEPAVEFIAADTTRQQWERERRLQAGKLEAVTRLIGNLVGEVRNALTPVVGFTELTMELPDLSPEVRSNLQIIAHGAERAKKTFDMLATWAQIRPPVITQVSINQLLEQMMAFRQYELQSYQIEMELDLESASRNTNTQADPQQLQLAFLAIIDNAKDALMELPQDRQVIIRTRREQHGLWNLGEVIEISFQDNGPGIARENLSRVFDPFFSTKPPTQALGLGLWIAYQIVKNHHGEIYIRSQEGEGATFIITLPVLTDHEPPEV